MRCAGGAAEAARGLCVSPGGDACVVARGWCGRASCGGGGRRACWTGRIRSWHRVRGTGRSFGCGRRRNSVRAWPWAQPRTCDALTAADARCCFARAGHAHGGAPERACVRRCFPEAPGRATWAHWTGTATHRARSASTARPVWRPAGASATRRKCCEIRGSARFAGRFCLGTPLMPRPRPRQRESIQQQLNLSEAPFAGEHAPRRTSATRPSGVTSDRPARRKRRTACRRG